MFAMDDSGAIWARWAGDGFGCVADSTGWVSVTGRGGWALLLQRQVSEGCRGRVWLCPASSSLCRQICNFFVSVHKAAFATAMLAGDTT